jgi:16S rRNA (uracil1498-N3)-methyltransferase
MPRFFAEIMAYPKAVIADQLSVRHISGPLRKKRGDILSIRDLSRGYEARICSLDSRHISLEIISEHELWDRSSRKIHLGLCIIDLKDMEEAIRGATELGAADIYPVVSGRSNIRSISEARHRRFQTIVLEAVKQCERKSIPPVYEAQTLARFVQETSRLWGERLVGLQEGKELDAERRKSDLGVLIGPEGGFQPEETDMVLQAGFIPVSLGKTVLRSVTAALAALSILGSS